MAGTRTSEFTVNPRLTPNRPGSGRRTRWRPAVENDDYAAFLRAAGYSWADIGTHLGTTCQAAHQRYSHDTAASSSADDAGGDR